MGINSKLPDPLSSDQIQEIVQWLIGLAGTYILSQGAVDAMDKRKET